MATTSHLITVREFLQLPEDGQVYHELRHGELVTLTRPKLKHTLIQGKLRDLLRQLAAPGSYVEVEIPFRALPEYELRVADVAYLSPERFAAADPEEHIQNAPDLVVEVLSPSNTADETYDKENLCLNNGASEFWVVDPVRRQVKVSTTDGRTNTYQMGQRIPLPLFDNTDIPVDSVFS